MATAPTGDRSLEHCVENNGNLSHDLASQMEAVLEFTGDAIFRLDREGNCLYVNRAGLELFGCERKEFLGQNMHRLVHHHRRSGEVYPIDECPFQNASRPGQAHLSLEEVFWRRDGTMIVARCSVCPIEVNGAPAGSVVTIRDVTTERELENQLAFREQQLRSFFSGASVGLAILDADLRFVEINEALARIAGLPVESCRGNLLVGVLPGLFESVQPVFARVLESREPLLNQDVSVRCSDSSKNLRYFTFSCFPVLANAALRGLGIVLVETSERKNLEAQLVQAQKMESIGTLAGGIAHDFNNILTGIICYSELAQAEYKHIEPLNAWLGQIVRASGRARDLISQILAFSRQQRHERHPVHLQPIVKEALKLLRSTLSSAIQIIADVSPDSPAILADLGQIHQVLMNLCANSAHAMRDRGGKLTVRLQPFTADASAARHYPGLKPGDYTELVVADTGCGIPKEIVGRIFDPFFTTKAPSEGTGLGLAVVHGIVREHDAFLFVESEVGVGTTFRIYFPAIARSAPAEENIPGPPPPGAGQRILVVDDEQAICAVAKLILSRLGYQTTTESSPEAALALLRSAPGDFDLVITDLNMPVMQGPDLATRMLRIRNDLPIVLATGFSDSWTDESVRRHGFRDMIEKPFTVTQLSAVISEVLSPSCPVKEN